MEVFLNSIWLVVAIGAFLFWQMERASKRRDHSGRQRFLALACALVMLFPVISLTDDLHAEQAAMEDSSRSVIKARNILQGCERAGSASFLATAPPASYSVTALHFFLGAVVLAETSALCVTPISAHDGRSPPSA